MTQKVTILDYGMGNLLNVSRAFNHLEYDVAVTTDPHAVHKAERLVVPGVGAFKDSIAAVRDKGFDEAIDDFIKSERPFLGICVGMQMLFQGSDEFGEHKGLGVFSGWVRTVPAKTVSGEKQRIPHIGWNALIEPTGGRSWNGTLLDGQGENTAVYFVHSFAAVPADEEIRLADCMYGEHPICAAVQKNNVMAAQFHPERSGKRGLAMLAQFMSL